MAQDLYHRPITDLSIVLEGSGIFGANKREAHKGQAMQLEIPIWDNKDESNKTNEESHELSEIRGNGRIQRCI